MATKVSFINSTLAQYTDEDFSYLQTEMFNAGILGDKITGALGLAVSQNGTPNMTVNVAVGKALVELTKSAITWKVAFTNTAIVNVAIASNASGANRVDAIIIRIDKDANPDALKTNIGTIERVAGTGVSALTDGAITTAVGSDGWIRLANITVANGAVSILNASIADVRVKVATNLTGKILGDTVAVSSGVTDANKIPVLNANGKFDNSFFSGAFGGSGVDGALVVTSGPTVIDLGGLQVFTKNYSSISITGTGYVTFINPHANGTIIVLKSRGDVTITTSATRAIDLRLLGGIGGVGTTGDCDGGGGASIINNGNSGYGGGGNAGTDTYTLFGKTINKGSGSTGGSRAYPFLSIYTKIVELGCGAGANGGASSPSASGKGGRGGGALYMECAGLYNVTGTIDASGENGVNANSRGGGGGGGGSIIALYNALTANTGTYNVSKGLGAGSIATTNHGGDGYSLVGFNTEF